MKRSKSAPDLIVIVDGIEVGIKVVKNPSNAAVKFAVPTSVKIKNSGQLFTKTGGPGSIPPELHAYRCKLAFGDNNNLLYPEIVQALKKSYNMGETRIRSRQGILPHLMNTGVLVKWGKFYQLSDSVYKLKIEALRSILSLKGITIIDYH